LNRPNLPGSLSSSLSLHEKLDGADDGPGEMGSPRFGVELPRALAGLRSSGLLVPLELPSSTGNGAVKGWLGEISIASTDKVIRCLFVGLLPALTLRPEVGASFLFATSFWKSCKQYISLMFGLIHLLLACAAWYASLTLKSGFCHMPYAIIRLAERLAPC
jgi:hypothetical protein